MNIYDPYPTTVEIDGKTIELDMDFATVLRVIDVQDDPALMTADKLELQTLLLLADPDDLPDDPAEQARIIAAAMELLPHAEKSDEPRYLDFHQDAALIRSGFMRAYGIDLTRDPLHICQFLELLADLPSDTALMRTIDIRRRPIPKLTKDNAEQVAELQRLKAKVAIKYSEDERRQQFAQSLKNSTALRG